MMGRPEFLDTMMKAQEQVIKDPEWECWSCGLFVPESRLVDKVWRDRADGSHCNELICFECIETGRWLK